MLANIAVLRTVKANVNEAIMVALPSILFESSHDKKDTQKYYLQGPAAEYIPVEIPDTYAKKFSKCATALAMQLVLLSNKTKGFFGPEICNVEGKDIQTARSIINSICPASNETAPGRAFAAACSPPAATATAPTAQRPPRRGWHIHKCRGAQTGNRAGRPARWPPR